MRRNDELKIVGADGLESRYHKMKLTVSRLGSDPKILGSESCF